MGPRVGLDGLRKISPPPGFDPRTVQPLASHYTDYANPAHMTYIVTALVSQHVSVIYHHLQGVVIIFTLKTQTAHDT